jgi:hypothetical protein
LTNSNWCAVAALVIGHGIDLHMIPVPIHQGVIDRIRVAVAEFWKMVAEGRPPPVDYARDGELLARMYPQDNGAEIDLSADNHAPQLVADLERARADKKDAETREKVAKTGINEKMGPARFARLADGRRISNATVDRKGFVVEATTFRMIKILGRAA